MNKRYLRFDIQIAKKMKDDEYKNKLNEAYLVSKGLKINKVLTYIKYQQVLNQLKNISYEEILAYERLLDDDYFNLVQGYLGGKIISIKRKSLN